MEKKEIWKERRWGKCSKGLTSAKIILYIPTIGQTKLNNLTYSPWGHNGARYTVVSECATLITASKLEWTNNAIVHPTNNNVAIRQRYSVHSEKMTIPSTTSIGDNNQWANFLLTNRKLYVAACRVGDGSNLKLCIHSPVSAEINRYTSNVMYRVSVNIQINTTICFSPIFFTSQRMKIKSVCKVSGTELHSLL